jgi:glyoxylase-like metal-dependent hydrolase (beta-lactamase superfamily II)
VTPERLIITNGDPDHVGGFDTVVDQYSVNTWIPEQTSTENISSFDHRYSGDDLIGSFEAIYTPGHEPDNYALVDEEAGILVPDDTIFGADLRGFPEGYLTAPPALYSENVNQAEESMEKSLDYSFDAVLAFHGTSVTDGAYRRLDSFVNFHGKPDWGTYQ